MRLALLVACLSAVLAVAIGRREGPRAGSGRERSPEDCAYAAVKPRQYVAYKTSQLSPGSLDGDLSKPVWAEVAWTDDFVDISTATIPRQHTRAKLRWDDSFLYVAAELQETQVWATLKEHNSVIFNDNDFEVFVDANATTHFYKEFEMNAFDTTWDLSLNKPYGDAGYENSSRVYGTKGFEMQPPLHSAVKLYPAGVINDPSTPNERWTVEIALPLEHLIYNNTDKMPSHGSVWRINFSRVQWHVTVDPATGQYKKTPACQSCPEPGTAHEDNWVWSPQGAIAMHLPEMWGILQFSSDAVNATAPAEYAEWPSRGAAMAVYYAEQAYAKHNHGQFTADLRELLPYSARPFEICASAATHIQLGGPQAPFVATVTSPASADFAATVRQDRFLTVTSASISGDREIA